MNNKILIWILSLGLLSCLDKTKIDNKDFLNKNSYYIFLNLTDSTVAWEGTGFFMNVEKRAYFITAKHLLFPYNDSCNDMSGLHHIKIMIPSTKKKNMLNPIDLGQDEVRSKIICPKNENFVAIEIDSTYLKDRQNINFIGTAYYSDSIQIDSASIFGFPRLKDRRLANYIFSGGIQILSSNSEISLDEKNYSASKTYKIKLPDMQIDTLVDFSGSPVYVRDKLSGNWLLLGCCNSNGINSKYLSVTKQSIIFSTIRNYTKKL